ncbi:Mdm33 family-domain-containing protein [Lophiotrema nucula]|uniref:Sensitive to high expression protein 9, mitochondrial n=1 Tax=Lophiotrema nucula TaxID=690887 RepID=A0A6A5ZSZ4_9PLEO|nr:Mdm33 family-domain-containing protein [Lophiotrema nucula]
MSSTKLLRRHFSSSRSNLEKQQPAAPTPESPQSPIRDAEPASTPKVHLPPPNIEDTIKRVPAEDLPSHKEGQRWDLSKRFQKLMDDLLPKIATVTHKVNTYTGTDYSSIEGLREEIKGQEQLVRARREAVDKTKEAFDAAQHQRAASQKEVVGLLERKHSWSAADLERYMSLIRSEHINDQAVTTAKDAVLASESALEEARTQLEKRERAQYHEEQIWSDTIRRNSTWVTFGLMGFNIFLLLASLVLIEPWRRRRLVREIKRELEAQKTAIGTAVAAQPIPAIEAAVDAVVEPAETAAEKVELVEQLTPPVTELVEATAHVQATVPDITADPSGPEPSIFAQQEAEELATLDIEAEVGPNPDPHLSTWQEKVTWIAKDILSERTISMRRIDFTNAMVQSAAAGAIIAGALVMILRPS